ncbi:MAG: tRNA (adenosine(37)-N6)-threonylcarbamoyltransferase complex ATPase subunit type 1 TsaE [Nitrospira sp.]|nr:tRNA (adenosine(37)-N6)-threonylcarbamoyltransferase complex ATPase subunit type 1 TsaE [Nitrospira sp.]
MASRPIRQRHAIARSKPTWQLTSRSASGTDRLGQALGHTLRGGEFLALIGTLGAGKTTLVRGIAKGLNACPMSVSSPTFILAHEYRGRLVLVHMDLYRIRSPHEPESMGLTEYLSGTTVAAVEWADKSPGWWPDDRLEIELRHLTIGSRRIRLAAQGPVSTGLLARAKTKFPQLAAARRKVSPA